MFGVDKMLPKSIIHFMKVCIDHVYSLWFFSEMTAGKNIGKCDERK